MSISYSCGTLRANKNLEVLCHPIYETLKLQYWYTMLHVFVKYYHSCQNIL